MDVRVKAEDEGQVEVKWSHVRSEWADGRTRGLWLLPRCWCLKAWWWLAPETAPRRLLYQWHRPEDLSGLARSSIQSLSQRSCSGATEASRWHRSDPAGITRPGRLAFLQPEIVFILKPWVCHTVTRDAALCTHLFVYCVFIMIFFPLLSLDGADPPAAASIQPSLTAAQFQLEPQPAELG